MNGPAPPGRLSRAVRTRRVALAALAALTALVALVGTALAHGGSLGGTRQNLSVPRWLVLLTGGGAVGASFLLASFVTDRDLIRAIHDERRGLGSPTRALVLAGRVVGVLGLLAVLAVGYVGPRDPLANLGVVLVWAGWWAGYTMTTYLVGNTWPVVNPWRTIASVLPSLDRPYPERLGAWPSVGFLLVFVWVEVVSPLADDPTLLADVVLVYTVGTLVGAVVFGAETWFETVDPISRVFAAYGQVAPLSSEAGRIRARWPGAALSDADWLIHRGDVAFVVALLWVTTYDGFVATPAWRTLATPLYDAGVPAHLLYPLALVVGFGLFYGAYRLAARYGRRYADSLLTTDELARQFAPSLLAIAAGYHVAHYLGYFLSLSPSLVGALTNPLSPPQPLVAVLPTWFGGVGLAFVLLGHVLAIWVAHATAFDLFPGRLQAIRSQYPLTAVMIAYTMTSLLIVSQPSIEVPFL
ncbi:hypothetical protein ACFPYI_03140 [Halomarina salina]|uniref:Uncharacterized protein n=1 Tax=Halomarina salina TaxID=1872699 RepID=A0ABD5RI97_9EURY|nr:hypothetical protein [Halomarina salina]